MVTSACLLLGTTLAMAEGARFFKIDGSYTAGYKIQNDLQTPWTTEGQITQGSGNRSQQTVNQNLVLNLMAIKMMDGQKAPEFMVYSQIKLNPNDPDASSKSDDGELGADAAVDVGEAFILWKPHMALDVVLGRQTVLATMNSGHSFYGPAEFQVATLASTNTGSSGLTIAGYLGSPSHKAGISMLNGAPKVTDLYDAGKAGYSDQGAEKATIVWYEGGFLEKSALKVKVAQQTIAVAKSVTTSDDHITSYDESESHTVLNIFAKYDMGSIAPWIGYWSATGKTVGGGDIEATNTSIGLEMKDLGPGNLAFEYAMVSTPELGETGSAWAIIDLKSVMSLDYQIEMAKDIALTLTYRQLATGDYWTEGDGADFMGGAYAPALAWTPSTMMAMSINYKFK